jgi:spoIIIJ-associated protein
MEYDSIQASGPSVEEAIARGLNSLDLTRDQVTVEVIDQGSRGILGLGAREAVVRLQPILQDHQKEPSEYVEPIQSPAEPREDQSKLTEPEAEREAELETYSLSQHQVPEIARQTLSELLTKMGIECEVVIRQGETSENEPVPLTLDVIGEGLNILIGRQGDILNALQYITRLIVSREVEHWVNLVVDIERYKQRRANSLKQLAKRIAERVARTKQPVALEPMPPNERRVIHITLRDHPTVTTQSVGKGERRKVTIIPKR